MDRHTASTMRVTRAAMVVVTLLFTTGSARVCLPTQRFTNLFEAKSDKVKKNLAKDGMFSADDICHMRQEEAHWAVSDWGGGGEDDKKHVNCEMYNKAGERLCMWGWSRNEKIGMLIFIFDVLVVIVIFLYMKRGNNNRPKYKAHTPSGGY